MLCPSVRSCCLLLALRLSFVIAVAVALGGLSTAGGASKDLQGVEFQEASDADYWNQSCLQWYGTSALEVSQPQT